MLCAEYAASLAGVLFLFRLGGELAAAGLNVDPAPDSNGTRDSCVLENLTKGFGPRMGGGFTVKTFCRVERNRVDVAQ